MFTSIIGSFDSRPGNIAPAAEEPAATSGTGAIGIIMPSLFDDDETDDNLIVTDGE